MGLCPAGDYEPLQLVKGDRLEPTLCLLDIVFFYNVGVSLPCDILAEQS